jgi:site-specific recombinase XerD
MTAADTVRTARDLMGLRDRVLLSVGFDTLCRRSELVAIRQDLTRNGNGTYSVLVRRAKNDQVGLAAQRICQRMRAC